MVKRVSSLVLFLSIWVLVAAVFLTTADAGDFGSGNVVWQRNQHSLIEEVNTGANNADMMDSFGRDAGATGTINSWMKVYGGGDEDVAYSVIETSNGNYVVVGVTQSFGHENGADNVWVLKLNTDGNIVWQKTYGGWAADRVYSVKETSDGGYIIAGETASFGAGWGDAWVLKLDANGNVVWQKAYGGKGEDRAYSVIETSDGGYIVVGGTKSFGAGWGDAWVLKLGANGNIIWQKTYGGKEWEEARAVIETSDGSYVVVGKTNSFGAGNDDVWVLKLDINGNIIWQKTYGGRYYETAYSVAEAPDRSYVVVGETSSFGAGNRDAWVLKLDTNGNVVWQKAYGGEDADEAYSIRIASDGNYIVAGRTESFDMGSGGDAWILKLNAHGNIIWQKTYGGKSVEQVFSVTEASDGGYVAVGKTFSFGSGKHDVLVLKLDANGNIHGCSSAVRSSRATPLVVQSVSAFSRATVSFSKAATNSSAITVLNSNASVRQICP